MEIEIGKGKTGRRSYGFDEVSIVPSRRTRDPEDIDISVNIGEYKLELPVLASAMDGVVDVKFAVEMRKIGGLAVLNLEGLQCRYDNADEILERISKFSAGEATRKMQEIYLDYSCKLQLSEGKRKSQMQGSYFTGYD
jgi:IMP dehydrogenase